MKKIIYAYMLAVASCVSAGTAFAADVTNNDTNAHTLEFTENGERLEIVIDAGQTISMCADGCFMTAPNGDRVALQGGEIISLVDGAAIVQ